MDYEVIENFLEPEQFLNIQAQLMSPEVDLPWYYRENMTNKDNFYFRHILLLDFAYSIQTLLSSNFSSPSHSREKVLIFRDLAIYYFYI